MIVTKGTTLQYGSCSFCQRGKVAGNNYYYPYKTVYHVAGSGIGVRFCEECIEKLKDYKEMAEATEIARKLANS